MLHYTYAQLLFFLICSFTHKLIVRGRCLLCVRSKMPVHTHEFNFKNIQLIGTPYQLTRVHTIVLLGSTKYLRLRIILKLKQLSFMCAVLKWSNTHTRRFTLYTHAYMYHSPHTFIPDQRAHPFIIQYTVYNNSFCTKNKARLVGHHNTYSKQLLKKQYNNNVLCLKSQTHTNAHIHFFIRSHVGWGEKCVLIALLCRVV